MQLPSGRWFKLLKDYFRMKLRPRGFIFQKSITFINNLLIRTWIKLSNKPKKMPNDIEKQYNDLKKKYKLPEFNEIDREFEFSDLEETRFLLRAMIGRIAERLEFYSTILEEILQPDTSNLYSMHETRYFNENEDRKSVV